MDIVEYNRNAWNLQSLEHDLRQAVSSAARRVVRYRQAAPRIRGAAV